MTTRFRSINTVDREIRALTRLMNESVSADEYTELRNRRLALLAELGELRRINAAEQATIVQAEAR